MSRNVLEYPITKQEVIDIIEDAAKPYQNCVGGQHAYVLYRLQGVVQQMLDREIETAFGIDTGVENKFPVGCCVSLIKDKGLSAKRGATAIVIGHKRNGMYLDLVWVRNSLSGNQMDGGYEPEGFVKILDKYDDASEIAKMIEYLGLKK